MVLQQCRRDSEERWKRMSRQVIDLLLPLLQRQQVRALMPLMTAGNSTHIPVMTAGNSTRAFDDSR